MQCPRCGLQNPPDITACARCGLAVWPAPPPSGSGQGRTLDSDDATGGGPAAVGPPPPPPPGSYGQSGYGPGQQYGAAAAAPSYAQPPQQYQPGTSATTPPYHSPYGTSAGSPYSTGPVAPYGATVVLPLGKPGGIATSRDTSDRLARLLLVLGVVASLGYAVWAMTARRGIFADFADNRSVSLDDARTSDRVDTTFLVIAGAIAVIALAVWLACLLGGRARSGSLAVTGLVISGLGLVCVVVGLVLSGLVGDGGSRVDQGQKAVTATIVTGSGFIALAVGLLVGCLVAGRSGTTAPGHQPSDATGGTTGW